MDQYPSITDSLGEDELRDIERSTKKIAIEQLFRNGLRAILFNIINPVILALIFLSQTNHAYIYIWLGALILLSVLRYAHILNRLPQLTTDKAAGSKCAVEFIGAASLTGLLWGTGFLILGPLLTTVNQIIFLLVLAGMAAGAYASMSSHRLTYACYLLSIFIPVLLSLFMTSSAAIPGDMLGLFIVVFVGMLLVTHKQSNTIILNSIRSELVKNLLIKKLQHAETENG